MTGTAVSPLIVRVGHQFACGDAAMGWPEAGIETGSRNYCTENGRITDFSLPVEMHSRTL